jgi:hypothetical protein
VPTTARQIAHSHPRAERCHGRTDQTDREPAGPTHTSPNVRPRTHPCSRVTRG